MLKSYCLRTGHFTVAQKRAYETLGPQYVLPFGEEPLDFEKTFNNAFPVILEIGFGTGIATSDIAQANPDKNYLGIEVHKPGIGRLLWEIEKRSLSNIRIVEYNAVFVIENMISDMSLDAVHVFFPDPWPKKKQRKRRLIRRPFTEILARKLKPGGFLYMVTDWEDYADYALFELNATSLLKNKYDNFAETQAWRPKTKFEMKGLSKSHKIRELYFIRNY
jgi:tRNA (guanine-N7-)-methyltransferase